MPDPLVSVLIISYNHEKYIRQAIEGCLMQQTSFPYEIIIHDDASTDSSAKIIQEYADKYPELIIPILQKENQYSKGVRIIATLLIPVARGKYIALCEGDDYWTNPQKLERQVDFLEKHSEFSGSAHQSLVLKEKIQKIFKQKVKPNLCLNDLLSGRVFHTASFLFRKKLYEKYPILSKPVLSFDRLLFLMIAAYGPIYFIDDPMCV
jgi:glycosyltransferase involved in cell wall biosynthesis